MVSQSGSHIDAIREKIQKEFDRVRVLQGPQPKPINVQELYRQAIALLDNR